MSTGVLLALTGDDAGIVRALDAPGTGLTVVRRCADLPELLSAGMAGLGAVAVVDTELDDLDRTVVDRLHRAGLTCLILCEEGDERRWRSMGLEVLPRPAEPEQVRGAVQALVRALPPPGLPGTADGGAPTGSEVTRVQVGRGGEPTDGARAGAATPGTAGAAGTAWWQEPVDAVGRPARPAPPPPPGPGPVPARPTGVGRPVPGHGDVLVAGAPEERGRIVAVWGPAGAPGRSTVAASLAQGLSAGGPVLLVDADLEAPCLVQLLGLPEDSSALASAARLATHGRLDDDALDRLVTPVRDNLGLLSGLGRPGRWRELPPASMAEVWERARHRGGWTVVDLAPGMEGDQVDDFALEPGRHAVAATLLEQADVVVVVGAADPVGVRRLVQLLGDLDSLVTLTGRLEVVVNRVRASAAGPAPGRAVREAVARFGGVEDLTLVPEDGATVDRCVLEGRSVLEGAPRTGVGRALAALADRVDARAGALAAAERPGRLTSLRTGVRRVLRPRGGAEPSRTRREGKGAGPSGPSAGASSSVPAVAPDGDVLPGTAGDTALAAASAPGAPEAVGRDQAGVGREPRAGSDPGHPVAATALLDDAGPGRRTRARRSGRHRR